MTGMMQLFTDCRDSRVVTTSCDHVLDKLGQHIRMHYNTKAMPPEATEAGGVGATERGLPTEVTEPHSTEPDDAGAIEPSETATMERGLSARVPQIVWKWNEQLEMEQTLWDLRNGTEEEEVLELVVNEIEQEMDELRTHGTIDGRPEGKYYERGSREIEQARMEEEWIQEAQTGIEQMRATLRDKHQVQGEERAEIQRKLDACTGALQKVIQDRETASASSDCSCIGIPTETSEPHTTVVTEFCETGAIEPSGSADITRVVAAVAHSMRLGEPDFGATNAKPQLHTHSQTSQKELQVRSKQLHNEISSTELSSTDVRVTSYKQHLSDKRLRQRSLTPRKDRSPSRERKPKYWCQCHPSGERCTYGGCTHHVDLDRNRHKIMMVGYANANAYRWCSALSLQEKNAFLYEESIELPDFDEDP